MDPVLRATLFSWDWRLEVILVLTVAGALYLAGWLRVRGRSGNRKNRSRWQLGAGWRPLAYLGGLFILAVALMSPIDVLGAQLFTMHMVQHVLLVMVVPPLLLLANPLPSLLWGLPMNVRVRAGPILGRRAVFRRWLRKISGPGIVWMTFVVIFWGWHDPAVYTLALSNAFIHDLEHITFFLVAMFFWWHVVGAGPRIHRRLSSVGRAAYVLSAIPPTMIAGIAIAFATKPLYSYYEAMPRLWGLSALEDQQIAGVIMWVPGSMMYMIAALILIGRWLQVEAEKPALPESAWANDEALIAPGWKE